MMLLSQKLLAMTKIAFCSAVIAVLTACGGGSDSTASQPATATPTSSILASASELSAYQGTWLGTCYVFLNGSNVAVGSSRDTVVYSQPAANRSITARSTDRFYTSTDCSGAAVASITEIATTLVFTGTKTINALTVNKIQATLPPGTPTFSGTASLGSCGIGQPISVNVSLGSGLDRVTQCNTILTTTFSVKAVVTPVTSSNTFDVGDSRDLANLDAAGYPNALLTPTEGRYTKQ
jgi:hypothetical protein